MEHALSQVQLEPSQDLFALTDEQILGIDAAGEAANTDIAIPASATDRNNQAAPTQTAHESNPSQPQSTQSQPPSWLHDRMNDPWHGEAARELWESTQKVQAEANSYREVFATPADAQALKDLYPGGVAEAKSAADRARQLEEIDAAYFGSREKPLAEQNASRAQLAKRLMEQDPAAFREMVSAGVELLERAKNDNASPSTTPPSAGTPKPNHPSRDAQRETSANLDEQQARGYAEFEKSANADLERSVGGTIARTLEQALPNLRHFTADPGSASLSARLVASVKEEIDAALKSDPQLGEQVAKILNARRFDVNSRTQIVRLIDARAQQLVPGAVRRVVGTWTQTALSAHQGSTQPKENNTQPTTAAPSPRNVATQRQTSMNAAPTVKQENPSSSRNRRPNYSKLTDEEILNL
jgi:hypothetical protein